MLRTAGLCRLRVKLSPRFRTTCMKSFPDFPPKLIYGEKLQLEENKTIEFKAVQESKKPIDVIQHYLRDYLNAFLNSEGGSIFFGIEDDSCVRGLFLTSKERD